MENSLEITGDGFSRRQVFIPQGADEPYDMTLVVDDGKKIKVHRRVLSEASPVFEKMLNSEIRETHEGAVRLEMITELGLMELLEYIYTGSVQISADDNAQDLVVMADYFDLPHLKYQAGRALEQTLNTLNSISTYRLAKKYHCEELARHTKEYIDLNFTNVAKTEEFLGLPYQGVKMWLSSDEINVNAEEDVFEIILRWTGHKNDERKKYFADLFREVRLIHVSRDFLLSDVVTNDLVKDNKPCLNLVKNLLAVIDPKDHCYLKVMPWRRSHRQPVIVVRASLNKLGYAILCYHPRENMWSRLNLPEVPEVRIGGEIITCRGDVFFISDKGEALYRFRLPSTCLVQEQFSSPGKHEVDQCIRCLEVQMYWKRKTSTSKFANYEIALHHWGRFARRNVSSSQNVASGEERGETAVFASYDLHKLIFLAKNEFYALACEVSCQWCFLTSLENERYPLLVNTFCWNFKQHESFVAKYHAESNLWVEIAPFPLGWRYGICIVAKDNFIYFLGGSSRADGKLLAKAGRYDLRTNKWARIADLQRPRTFAYGADAYGKVFVVGGDAREMMSVEAYDELTNEWHLKASIGMWPCPSFPKVVCVDERLFALHQHIREYFLFVRCYDWDNNSWKIITKIPVEMLPEVFDTQIPNHTRYPISVFSMRLSSNFNLGKQGINIAGRSKHANKCSIV